MYDSQIAFYTFLLVALVFAATYIPSSEPAQNARTVAPKLPVGRTPKKSELPDAETMSAFKEYIGNFKGAQRISDDKYLLYITDDRIFGFYINDFVFIVSYQGAGPFSGLEEDVVRMHFNNNHLDKSRMFSSLAHVIKQVREEKELVKINKKVIR